MLFFDGYADNGNVIAECFNPWRYRCDGNQHNYKHLKMKYLASLSDKERKKYLNKNG